MIAARFVCAQSKDKQAISAEDVKQIIENIGEGYQSRVSIRLLDETKLEGYISTIGDDFFALTNVKAAKTIKVAYGDVKQVKRQKPSRSPGSRDGIVAIVGAIAIVVFAFVVYAVSDRKG